MVYLQKETKIYSFKESQKTRTLNREVWNFTFLQKKIHRYVEFNNLY